MAKKKKKPMVARRKRSSGNDTMGVGVLILIAVACLTLFSSSAAIVMAVGLVPTIVLSFTIKGELKSPRLQCVAYANVAGVLPFVKQAWGTSSPNLERLISDPINLVAMLGSAAIGYALLYVGPVVASYILQGMSADRLKTIAQQRQALVDLWSSDVLGDKEEEKAPTGRFLPRSNPN